MIEIDSNDKKYEGPRICPLTGGRLDSDIHWRCVSDGYVCDGVDPNKWGYLYGHRYRCQLEYGDIVRWHDRLIESAKEYKRLSNSLEAARSINLEEFFSFCESLDKDMIRGRQAYTRDMVINPYHAPEDKSLIYYFEGDEVVEISVVDNPFTHIGNRFNNLREGFLNSSLSCCDIPGYLSEAINVRLHLIHNMDVKSLIHYNNPVYVQSTAIGKYIDATYGWDWVSFKKAMARHLEMTEIVNYGNIIYIKQELDEIIRRES